MPLVSIIIPIFNSRPCPAQMTASLRAQQWPELDIIGIDDSSAENAELSRL